MRHGDAFPADPGSRPPIDPSGAAQHLGQRSRETRVTPDRAMLSIGVETQGESAAVAASNNARMQSRIIETVKGAGVPAAQIRTSGYNVYTGDVRVEHRHGTSRGPGKGRRQGACRSGRRCDRFGRIVRRADRDGDRAVWDSSSVLARHTHGCAPTPVEAGEIVVQASVRAKWTFTPR